MSVNLASSLGYRKKDVVESSALECSLIVCSLSPWNPTGCAPRQEPGDSDTSELASSSCFCSHLGRSPCERQQRLLQGPGSPSWSLDSEPSESPEVEEDSTCTSLATLATLTARPLGVGWPLAK